MTQPALKAPFAWYGGKARAAHLVWPHCLHPTPGLFDPEASR